MNISQALHRVVVFKSPGAAALALLVMSQVLPGAGCADVAGKGRHVHTPRADEHGAGPAPDRRVSLGLDPAAVAGHQAIMHAHFEAVHQIVAALGREDYAEARAITENELGFAKHREAMRLQKPEDFPPAYHDLAMAHHEAAENLANAIPSRDMKLVLPQLERTLHACVACHRAYKQ